ncbi:MAG: DinB/UmuC family translesion DNA polymerase, partial [Acidimicrobiales bacterium]
ETSHCAKSVGAQSALGRRWPTPELLRAALGYLADRVAGRMRAAGRAGRTVTARVRFVHLRSVTRSITLPVPISATLTLTEVAYDLVQVALADNAAEHEITLLAVSVSNLVSEPALQLEMPLGLGDDQRRPGTATGATRWSLDRSVDAVRARFGREAVGYANVVFSEVSQVPEEFRDLAERDQ